MRELRLSRRTTFTRLVFLLFIFVAVRVYSNEEGVVKGDLLTQKAVADVNVTGRVESNAGKYSLVLTVSNNSRDVLELPSLGLHRLNIAWVLMEMEGSGRVLEELSFPNTPSPGGWVLEPGEAIEEALGLNSYYPQLLDVLKRNVVVLYWSLKYDPFNPEVGRQGGFIEIERVIKE